MQHRAEHGDRLPGTQRDPAAEHGVLAGVPAERGGGRIQPQRFVEHLPGVGEPPDLVERRLGVGRTAPQRVDLALHELEYDGVLGQVVQRERHRSGRRLMARDEEGDHLVADVGGVERAAVGGVLDGEHEPEKVVGLVLFLPHAGGDHVVDDPREIVRVRPEGRVRRRVVAARRAGQPRHAPIQAADHGLDEGMRFVPLEGAEVVAESGESDGVERHPRHVVGDVHGLTVASAAVPGLDEAVRHAQHHGVVCAHGAQRERGHQDVVRLGPVGLVVVRGEQSVGGELAHVLQSGPDRLREPALVGQIGDQVEVAHEERVPAVQPSYEHGSVLAHQSHHLLERGAAGAGGGDVDQGEAVGGRALAGQAVGGACCLGSAYGLRGACCLGSGYGLGGICGLGVRRGGGHGATTAFRGTGSTAIQLDRVA